MVFGVAVQDIETLGWSFIDLIDCPDNRFAFRLMYGLYRRENRHKPARLMCFELGRLTDGKTLYERKV